MKRTYVFALALLVTATGCGRGGKRQGAPTAPETALGDALAPAAFARAVARMGGAHFHGVTHLKAVPAGAPPGAGPSGASPSAGAGEPAATDSGAATDVTTTTDVWVDRVGNYRLREDNDRDGGREVVLYGRELSVALRYGRMIRRVAEEPEPRRLLEQGLGGPAAVLELCAPHARVTRVGAELYAGAKTTVYEIALGDGTSLAERTTAVARPTGTAPVAGLRAWRSSAVFEAVSGRVAIDDVTGAVMKADMSARFSARAEGGPVAGTVEVHTILTEVAATPAIERPAAEELASRQRIVPEQRELLRGLAEVHPPPEPPRRAPPKHAAGDRP